MRTKVQDNVPRRALLPPGQANARAAGRSMLAMAMLLLLMWCVPQRAMAGYIDDFKKTTISDHLDNGGYISVSFIIYNSEGKDDGIDPDWHKSHIDIDSEPVLFIRSLTKHDEPQPHDNKGYRWAQVFKTNSSKVARIETQVVNNISTREQVWSEVTAKNAGFGIGSENKDAVNYHQFNYLEPGDETYTYAEFRIYPSAEWMKDRGDKGEGITVSGARYIDCTDSGAGTRPDFDVAVEPKTCRFTIPNAPSLSYNFSQDVGYQSLTFQGTQNDKYRINGGTQTTIANTGSINTDFGVQNSERKVTVDYYKRFSAYQYYPLSSSITIPAYQHPTDFKVTQQADGDVKVTWSIAAYSGSVVKGGEFEVQRSKDEKFATAETVGTLPFEGAKSYSLTDDVSEKNLNGKYYYRLRRTNASAWNWSYVKTASLDLSMKHKKIATARGENIEDGQVKLTWTYDGGNIWSDNSNVMVKRTNTTTGVSTTYAIADDLNITSYTETLPTNCDVYIYNIYVQPGNSVYATQAEMQVVSDGNLYSTSIGYVATANASKGYYSDRVSLEWEIEGGSVDEFSIRAREYGSNGEWKQIEQINANVASSTYQYSDTKAVPGVIYEYSIVAVKACGGDNDQIPYEGEIIGFRTPTGDIYGRVTFENGQAVADVEVRAEIAEGEGIAGKAYVADGNDKLTIGNGRLLQEAAVATLEAWIRPEAAGTIIKKAGMYELTYKNGKIAFKVGTQEVTSASAVSIYTQDAPFVHVAAVADEDYIYIYLNGVQEARAQRTATVTGNANQVVMAADGYKGAIDEVRIWNVARTAADIERDYGRYLVGNETGLMAYYTFDYAVASSFFDISYNGINYNQNHGVVSGATLSSTDIPTLSQLGHKGYTGADGAYSIRALPYRGNGTSYMIIPRLGIHQFESEKELRLLNAQAQSHTVNFTDKSSFKVTGKVMYKGGSIPVEGVSFYIDGTPAMGSKNELLKTDAKGMFEISVPVGQHEVKAVMQNHEFELGGRITNSDGTDRNYQDEVSGIELYDITTVRYGGRVAGGAVQEEFPLGHSLSTNNLADGVTVTLTYQNESYMMTTAAPDQPLVEGTVEKSVTHFNNKHKTTSIYKGNTVTIYPDAETGEFEADVLPINYKVTVNVPGHDNMPGNGEELSLSNSFAKEDVVYDYTDEQGVAHSDTTRYNKKQLFIKRYTPTIDVQQLEGPSGRAMGYFGKKQKEIARLDNSLNETVTFVDDKGGYALGMPVFEQGNTITMGISVYEEYIYKDEEGKAKAGMVSDKVPTTDATLSFAASDLPYGKQEDIEVNEMGYAEYTFKVDQPEFTAAQRTLDITMSYGEDGTSVNWRDGGLDVIVLGAKNKGTGFVTAGPDKVLFVLRDPPGSNSYAYLEKGATFTSTETYNGIVFNEGQVTSGGYFGTKTQLFTGASVETINVINNVHGGVVHSEEIGGTNSWTETVTTTTRFQTSADPLYVGANGDLYVGYSTNITVGQCDNLTVVSKDIYNESPGEYEVYEDITPIATSDVLLVKTNGINLSQSFNTLFAYPQIHIEQVLIPELTTLRNKLLYQQTDNLDFQAMANKDGKPVYVSKLTPDDPDYGMNNSDEELFDGDSYKIYFPENVAANEQRDTILILNQWIDTWRKRLKENEEHKAKASTLVQNYSFQAGTDIEYSESFTHTTVETTNFKLGLGVKVIAEWGATINSTGVVFNLEETIKTEHGGEFTNEEEANNCKGFVLAESGDDDYLSVDVLRESGYIEGDQYVKYDDINSKDQTFSTFVFKTKGGATSCPYEDADVSKYYEPGQHVLSEATIQLEVPEISVEKSFIENVPSGQSAYFTLYLRNNSEAQEDCWYDLVMDDASNPYGAQLIMDGAPIGNGRALLVPAGETLVKTLEVRKGTVMNYDNLRLKLQSQCQSDPTDFLDDIFDDVIFSVHFIPSATNVNISKPSKNWTYNTQLPTVEEEGVKKHYMEVVLDGFDVNYDNFYRIKLQYKPASASDNDWTTLMNYYNDQALYDQAIANGQNAEMILAADAGTIKYKWMLDDLQDQHYDLRAVGTSMINNVEYEKVSEVYSGIKDMYNPRLFGSAQPANGVLTINDEIRLNFNETIAEGYLTDNNFQVTGVRNGAQTDHAVSVYLDGVNDRLTTEFARNWTDKDLTIEMWILADKAQDAVLFSQGNADNAMELGITAGNRLKVKVGKSEVTSDEAVPYEQGTWAHVALVYHKDGRVSAYYNYVEYISGANVGAYSGEGAYCFGGDIHGGHLFAGKMHNARIWDKAQTSGRLQTNSLTLFSGAESNLMAYYPMNEGKGSVLTDKARGVNLAMNGSEWAMPEGRAVTFNGVDQYLKLATGAAVVDYLMDYTLEFWFNGAEENKDTVTLVSNGRGDGNELGGSRDLFSIGIENGALIFRNNGVMATAEGNWLDGNWHHVALTVSRTNRRAQILIDGKLNTYFDAADLGGVAAAYITLGARSYMPADSYEEKVDNFFKGAIDEFRLWNLYKNEKLVDLGNTEGLDGTEMGLMAYYPFQHYIEWQGTKELQFTLKDMKVQADPEMGVADAVAYGGDIETSVAAPVRDKGPVSKLNYNFVVNNDALIITLDESWDRVEKTTVTFSVDGVRDLNGNKQLNPITWSAYIDRNQLKWSESDMMVEKMVNEEKSFAVKVTNNGGAIQNFTIENMPSWLDVNPVSGAISPLSSVEITFTVDAGLNIGTYDEVIYMRNDNNVVEALPLTVKVCGEKPEWSVNPADYKYTMSVFGKLQIGNVFSIDEEDMLAVFDGAECVGVAYNQYYKANDMYYAMLTIYSNEVTKTGLEFRIWDASTGITYVAIPGQAINFTNNGVVGTSLDPVVFIAKDIKVQRIGLAAGWNWISFNVSNENLGNINELLKGNAWTQDDQVKSEEQGFASYSTANGWVGELTGFDNLSMYMMHSAKNRTLDVTGEQVDAQNTKLTIVGSKEDGTKRWNYISYLPAENLTLKEALAGYDAVEGDIIKSQDAMAMYSGNLGWIGSLTYMENGKGYMMQRQATTEATLQYPTISAVAAKAQATRSAADEAVVSRGNNQYATNMTVVARLTGVELAHGDRLVAYVGGERRGETGITEIPAAEEDLFFLTIGGDKAESIDLVLERDGQTQAYAGGVLTYGSNRVIGTVNNPMEVQLAAPADGVQLYPQPFEEVLNIRMDVDAEADVNIVITDVRGATLAQWTDCNANGYVHAVWTAGDAVPTGIYMVIVSVDGVVTSHKVVKK